ncbi:carbohydrate ABC transporter permease [Halarsenatibacter silvermanii]|uniref:Carbohydrate ABC transporter membrane protein 1, CUT1 family n=1 Tax=Halarsenatibacter silvermanii TaxID=321763 RepID=A0A1G9HEP9_9FIRM|nr:sugar ABC transporter permease [Halarsenatibacter silvermanii]SDL11184.1 carbohydrate ABC transporter membrane protein 1, CUT1 family [Halarsenatibacter silvermanii]
MSYRLKEKLISLGLMAPSIIAIGVFVYGFIGRTLQVSFMDWNNIVSFMQGVHDYVGLENFRSLMQDTRFITGLWNNFFFMALFILGTLTVGILLAVIINDKPRGHYFFQNLYLFPFAVSFVVTGTVWRWIFSPGSPRSPRGINMLFHQLGVPELSWEWFTSTGSIGPFNIALVTIVIAAIWQFSGYTMAMWLAGLRGIPEQLIEAARIDGASKWQIFTKILFPMLKPITLSAIIILAHISLKAFDLVYVMTGSGPRNVTDIPAVYMYETTFRGNNYSTGAGISIILLMMVGVLIIPYLISTFREA